MIEVHGDTAEELKYRLRNMLESQDPESGWDIVISGPLGKGIKSDERAMVIIRSSMLGAPRTNPEPGASRWLHKKPFECLPSLINTNA